CITSVSQKTFPDKRSRQMTQQETPLLVAVVTITRSPHTIGEDQPKPGISAFQTTLELALHSIGTPVSEEMPCPVGPRKPGQLSARPVLVRDRRTRRDKLNGDFKKPPRFGVKKVKRQESKARQGQAYN